jgi:hypothetical protein
MMRLYTRYDIDYLLLQIEQRPDAHGDKCLLSPFRGGSIFIPVINLPRK